MGKTAFAIWEGRIAPVFDAAQRLHIVEAEEGRIVRESDARMTAGSAFRKVEDLQRLGVDTLVCGAVSRFLQGLLASSRIRVSAFVAGTLEEARAAWLAGKLDSLAFSMPGCRLRGRRCRRRVSRPPRWGNGTDPF